MGKPPHRTMAAVIHVKLLTAMPASIMPNATALFTRSTDWIRSNALLKNGAAVSASVSRTGRSKFVVRYRPAYTARNLGHCKSRHQHSSTGGMAACGSRTAGPGGTWCCMQALPVDPQGEPVPPPAAVGAQWHAVQLTGCQTCYRHTKSGMRLKCRFDVHL